MNNLLEEELEQMFPHHDCSLSLEHNQHKNYHESIERWEENLRSCSSHDKSDPVTFGWVSVEQRNKAIKEDSVWCLQWYPDTPIGSCRWME